MKKFKQLIKELPSNKVIFAFGRWQPPTIGHALLVNAVKKLAVQQKADHYIFASKTQDKKQNPLPVDRKVYYLNKMFPNTNFVAADEKIRTFIEAAAMLSQKYKHLVMVAGSDRVPNYRELLEKYNGKAFTFETVEVVSAGERDPDSDTASGMSGTKMREAAKTSDFASFKKGLPHTLTELDGKRLMNEVRQGLGLEPIKEQIIFTRQTIREQYHSGKIFNIGDYVTDGKSIYEIADKGANYVTVVNEHGDLSKKWLSAISPIEIKEDIQSGAIPTEVSFKGYTTKNLHHSEDAIRAFEATISRYKQGAIKDTVAILNALKATDVYMKINDLHLEQGKAPDEKEYAEWRNAHQRARDCLNRIGEFMHHFDYWHMHEHEIQDIGNNYTVTSHGEDFVESFSDQLNTKNRGNVSKLLEKIADAVILDKPTHDLKKTLSAFKLNPDFSDDKDNESDLDAGRGHSIGEPSHVGSSMTGPGEDHQSRRKKIRYRTEEFKSTTEDDFEELGQNVSKNLGIDEEIDDLSDEDLDKMIANMSDDDYWHAYDDDELAIVDDETGEEVDDLKEDALNEVLSRVERIKAKMRFARSASKRAAKLKVALKRRSSSEKILSRARRLAIQSMKSRLAKKPLNKLSVDEKERLERIIQSRKAVIGRLATKLAPRIRKIENDRLSHSRFTK